MPPMLILGIESSCDETGLALYRTGRPGSLLSHALYSQIQMHQAYGGVVPELASRDHIRRVVPLLRQVMADSGLRLADLDAIAYTQGPGLAGALLVGAAFAEGLAMALGIPTVTVHHLEGHLLSPLLSQTPPRFPFIALLVSGGHSQIMHVSGVGEYQLLGETLDDAAGEAFDKTAKLLGLPYPGGAALSELARSGRKGIMEFPRPMLHSKDLNFSFSGLKTAVLTQVRQIGTPNEQQRADIARAFEEALIEVLTQKTMRALRQSGLKQLVVAGGVGANRQLRSVLNNLTAKKGISVYYPEFEFCTDNGAMIALAGALRLESGGQTKPAGAFAVKPRWPLSSLTKP